MLDSSMLGTANDGAPLYVGATPSPTPVPTPTLDASPSTEFSDSSRPEGTASGVPLLVVLAVASGALVLGGAGTGAALLLRRRRRPVS